MMLLGSAAGLLDRPGCPACRYTSVTGTDYLTWFASEGHADAVVLTQLTAARGMCAHHSRSLIVQPGAPHRLTAVYRYVLDAAVRDPTTPAASCLACVQAAEATARVLAILADEVMARDRTMYKRQGGLCVPHLRALARQQPRQDLVWPVRFALSQLTTRPVSLSLVTGLVPARPVVRIDPSVSRLEDMPACSVCWAASAAEQRWGTSLDVTALPPEELCAAHVLDCVRRSGDTVTVATRQAGLIAERLERVLASRPRRIGLGWRGLSARARSAFAEPDCPGCRARAQAESAELRRVIGLLAAGRPDAVSVCARHVRALHEDSPAVGYAAATVMRTYGARLAAELAGGRAGRATWLEVIAFLDGAVLLDGTVDGEPMSSGRPA